MNTNEKMKQRKIKAVTGYHKPNKHKEPELYFCHLLMLYYPWRHEGTLLDSDDTYVSKFYETNVKNIVEHNREMFEPDAEAVTEALECLRNNQNDIIYSVIPLVIRKMKTFNWRLKMNHWRSHSINKNHHI